MQCWIRNKRIQHFLFLHLLIMLILVVYNNIHLLIGGVRMIRKLTVEDHKQTMNLLNEAPAENLFILGDIEAFGYEQDFQTLWGDFDENDSLRAVMLKYQQNFIPYAPGSFDAQGFADVINNSTNFKELSGLDRVSSQVQPYIKHDLRKKRRLFYAKCDHNKELESPDLHTNVKLANVQDIDQIIQLHSQIDEFVTNESHEEMRRNMEKGITRTYFLNDNGVMVSAASTAAENSKSAMVVGVCTLNDYKRKGYASQCMSKLCYDVLSEGKELCLFYDNPDAGKIYKRLGFREIDHWTMFLY